MKIKVLALASLLACSSAYADIRFNGFATIAAGATTSSNDTLYGYDSDIDFKNNSLIALQATSSLGDGLGVTAQIIARGENDWDPKFEWAYVSYDATDSLRFLVGRQRAPFYMFSDYLDVSYAYAWIKPPQGVYNLVFDSFDGIGAIHTSTVGEFDLTTHVIYGKNDTEFTTLGETITPDFKNLVGVAFSGNRDWLTLRAAYFRATMTFPFQGLGQLAAGWRQAGFNDIADNVLAEDDSGTFLEFGVNLDYNDYLLIAEYTKLTLDTMPFSSDKSYYLMLGKRVNDFVFHVTYGKDDDTQDDFTEAVPYGLDPSLDFLKQSTQGLLFSQRGDSKYTMLGMRWNFHSSAALKFEYTHFSDKLASSNDADLLQMAIVTVF